MEGETRDRTELASKAAEDWLEEEEDDKDDEDDDVITRGEKEWHHLRSGGFPPPQQRLLLRTFVCFALVRPRFLPPVAACGPCPAVASSLMLLPSPSSSSPSGPPLSPPGHEVEGCTSPLFDAETSANVSTSQ
jgi:hypothetical protein